MPMSSPASEARPSTRPVRSSPILGSLRTRLSLPLGLFGGTSAWSDPLPVRAEIFGVERLEQHARSLAAAQPVTLRPIAVPSLRRRLDANAAVLLRAYVDGVMAPTTRGPVTRPLLGMAARPSSHPQERPFLERGQPCCQGQEREPAGHTLLRKGLLEAPEWIPRPKSGRGSDASPQSLRKTDRLPRPRPRSRRDPHPRRPLNHFSALGRAEITRVA